MHRTADTRCYNLPHRTEDEISALILRVASNPTMRKKMIMYEVFLSHRQVKEYLALLIEKGLLEYQKGNMTYKTTEKGNLFL